MSTDRVFGALAVICDSATVAARDLMRQLAFAYITGNGDAHAKNFSVLQGLDGEWRVSPAYDMPSSYLYNDKTMALSIGGRTGGDFGSADFIGLGRRLGIPSRAVERLLAELTERVDLWLGELPTLPFDNGKIVKLGRVIKYRCGRLMPASR